MKLLILWGLLVLSVYAAPKGKGSGEASTTQEILPLSNVEVVLACTKGSTLGEQYAKAFNDCVKQIGQLSRQAANGKGKGKTGKGKSGKGKSGKGKAGKGKGGRRCPSSDDVMSKLRAKAEKDTCVFNSLGWVDGDGKVIKDVMEQAIKLLPAEVASQMSQNSIETCANDKAKEWSQRPKRQRCDPTYSPADRDGLTKYEANVAGMKCIKTVISTSCRSFISKPVTAETIPLPLPSGNNGPKPIVNGPGGSGGSSSSEETSGLQGEIPIPIGVNPETVPLPISPVLGEDGSSEEGGSSEDGGSSEEGGSSEGGGYSHGGQGHGGHGNAVAEPFPIEGGSSFGPFPSGGLPFPIFPGPIAPGFGQHPSQGNFQQVIVESPQAPSPYFPPPSQSFPERWPSNLVAALVPADWAAENLSFQFGQADEEYDYDYEEYYSEYNNADIDEYGGDIAEEYPDEYNYDYAEDDTDTLIETSPEEPPIAVAVPLPLALDDEGEGKDVEEATEAKTEAPTSS